MKTSGMDSAGWAISVALWCATGVIVLAMGLMELGAVHHDLYCPDHGSRVEIS